MSKKNKVAELAAKGNLSRAEIARQAECTPSFVTQTLGAQRTYKRKVAAPCEGCTDKTCLTSGCVGA